VERLAEQENFNLFREIKRDLFADQGRPVKEGNQINQSFH